MTDEKLQVLKSNWQDISISLLLASLTYDFFYYFKLGLTFPDIPTSIVDHLRSSLEWLPPIVLILLFQFFMELVFRKTEKGMTIDELNKKIATTKYPRLNNLFHHGYKKLSYCLLTIFPLVTFLLFGENVILHPLQLPIAAVLIWISLYRWISSFPRFVTFFNSEQRVFIYYLFMFIFFLSTYGYSQASFDVKNIINGKKHIVLFLKVNDLPNKAVLKFVEKGAITFDKEIKEISFYPWKEIQKIQYETKPLFYTGILSYFFRKKS